MFKKITIMLMLALLVTTVWARDHGLVYHEIEVVDELGRPVTDINDLYIYVPGTNDTAVIYMDRTLQNVIHIPMTEISDNTTLIDGYAHWWGQDGWDFSVTNNSDVGPMTNAGHEDRTASDGRLVFPSYFSSMATTHWDDAQSITMGTGPEWTINGGGVANTLSFIPTGDDFSFIVGSVNAGFTSSFYVPTGATDGLVIHTGAFTWDGGAVLLNHNSNDNVGICTGNSDGDVTIGNAAGGAFSVETDSTITMTADDAFLITNTTAGQDITIDSQLGSIILDSGEIGADDAIVLVTTGAGSGIDITSLGDIDITTTGEAGEDITILNTGGSINILSTEDAALAIYTHANSATNATIHTYNQTGTAASAATQFVAAIQLKALVGGIGLYSALDDDNAIRIESNGGVLGTINIHNNQGEDHAAGIASIQLLSDDGAIGLMATNETAAGAGESAIQLTASAGAIELLSGLDATEAIKLTANGGVNSDIVIWNDTGNTADSIEIFSDLGGISIHNDTAAENIAITSTGSSVIITSTEAVATAVSLIATTGAGGITFDSGSNGVNFSDDNIVSVGDITCDDILADANEDKNLILSAVKCLVVTIDVDNDASTDDFSFDDDQVNMTEQGIRVAVIPAWCEIIAVQVRCLEEVTGTAVMGIEIGTIADGAEIVTTSNCDAVDDAMGTAAGESPEIAASSAAINVFVSGTPGANWNGLDEGRWAIHILYADYAAAYTQCAP